MVDYICVEGKHWKDPKDATECHRKHWHNDNCDLISNNLKPSTLKPNIINTCPICKMQTLISNHCINPDCRGFELQLCPHCSSELHWETNDGLWECQHCKSTFDQDLHVVDAEKKFRRETIITIVVVCVLIAIILWVTHPNW
jgi:hypothetical protein